MLYRVSSSPKQEGLIFWGILYKKVFLWGLLLGLDWDSEIGLVLVNFIPVLDIGVIVVEVNGLVVDGPVHTELVVFSLASY